MKKWSFLITVIIAITSYGIFLNLFSISILDSNLAGLSHGGKYYDYRGVTHVHSSLSTGSAPQDEIAADAREAGLDFIFFTELNYFGQGPRPEGYFEKVLMLQADEISYLDSHLLLYSLNKKSFSTLGDGQVYLSDLLSRRRHDQVNEFAVLAHPYKDGYLWSGEYPNGLLGIETLNLKSIWQEAWNTTRLSFLWSLFIYPFNPQLSLMRMYVEPKKELALWQSLNQKGHTTAFLGNDTTAHALPLGKGMFKFPTYLDSFKIASNHILLRSELTGQLAGDKEKIFRALMNGQFYLCLDLLGDPKGFSAELLDQSTTLLLGEHTTFKPNLKILVTLPKKPFVPFEIGLYKDGTLQQTSNQQTALFLIKEKGVYNILVRTIPTLPLPDGRKWLPWIYTNAFYIM
ncbi:MAG: hypothetical protein SGJ18_07795 [Pseudomonadota bacterium]|nr:hypothetical protein [Pseudomonadota bacterium]